MGRPRALATSWGGLVARRRWAFVAAWALLVAALAVFASGTSRLLSPAGFETDTEASRAADVLRQQFPERQDPVLTVVLQSGDVPLTDPAYQAEAAAWRTDLVRLVGGSGVVRGPLPGRDGRTAALVVSSNEPPDHFIEVGRQTARISHPGPAHALVGGFGAIYDSFIEESEQDLQQSERLSAPIALALLLLVFGGLVAGLLPVLTGLASVTVAVALLGFAARLHTVSVFSLNITSVVGLGLGIDYSLLIVNRFREEIRRGRDVEAAVAATVGTAGVATVVSGGTVAIGFGALTLSRLNVLWSIGAGGAIVVAVSVLTSLTLIPALLAVFGRHVDRLSLPFARNAGSGGRVWHALAGGVMARPFLFIAAALAVIALLVAPARGLRLGVVGAESLPPGDAAARATSLAREQLGFPAHSPVLVVARGVRGPEQAAELERRVRAAAEGQPVIGPADVSPERLPLYLRGEYAVLEVQQPAGDNDERTQRWLDRLRTTPWPAGVRVQLGGEAPAYQDFLRVLTGDAPLIVGTVLGLTFVLLGLAFRSLALPVKAVLMNLLSVGAALGVLTWGFQDGGLARLLDFRAVGFVDATAPVIIFAGLFGLSMDYEVFLLSRVREEWAAGRTNAGAVAFGMERTGRIITSAALILVVVVSTLGLSHLALNKSFGVTFAVAILLDATVIRLLLVPAMMRVLGDLNWWPARRPAEREAAAA